ncbi:MAG: hypothetical protein ACRD8O_18650, partial [Bryobacteraceae bacterium]
MWYRLIKFGFALVLACAAPAQDTALDPRSSIKIDLPGDSPLTLVSSDFGESRATSRGGAMELDLHMGLMLRNSSRNRVRGVTVLVSAQEVTPGGKASVARPSLDVGPGDVFPLRIDMRLLSPRQPSGGALVRVTLDGVLFHDHSFYGPNRLDSRRSMMVWETEAQRDRQYFKSILQTYGPDGLHRAALDSLNRLTARPRLDVQVAWSGRATAAAAQGPEREVQFAFLQFPGSPIEPMQGSARVAGNEARSPRIEVRNRSSKAVRHYEIGWIVKDREGREFWAASIPAADDESELRPGHTGSALQT